ncbi:hypothetical protein FRB96_005822 [Tulasnella sp. 330]|nr:hypothetical protein FRB96_005822 [Tulasnella sp. 330]KAG8888632.1 hypothetical protein FRB98_007305 [Tulasnella sp. 332]
MKHGSFSGSFYTTGSDDFRAYIWKIPPTAYLLDRRRQMSIEEWKEGQGGSAVVVGYCNSWNEPPLIPEEISAPTCRTGGHRSIVNTSLFHPHLPILATAGIESHICLHRPFLASVSIDDVAANGYPPLAVDLSWKSGYLPPRELPPSIPPRERHRLLLTMLDGRQMDDSGGVQDAAVEDMRSTAMFDELLRQDGRPDVFVSRAYQEDSDSDDERTEGPTLAHDAIQDDGGDRI